MERLDHDVADLVSEHGAQAASLLAVLRGLDRIRGGLTQESIVQVAGALGVPVSQAYGVASFYSLLSIQPRGSRSIRVCDSPACWLAGAAEVHKEVREQWGDSYHVTRSSCLGLCDRAPAALVDDEACGPLVSDQVIELAAGWRGTSPDYASPRTGELRVLLEHAGHVDPESIESALAHGSYRALGRALRGRPKEVIGQVAAARLMGRGGAGFSTARKWETVAQQPNGPKYVVCNADESEPLAFKDRVLIDTHPHQVLEGIALAGYAVGASHGIIYIRGEYEAQARRLERAIAQAVSRGWLGRRIAGSDYSLDVELHRGAGAYICGEETALLESLEGRRGEPRPRPPFPAVEGLWRRPTVVNNVETLAAVPAIVDRGGAWYGSLGNRLAPGTKLYTLLGHVRRPGLFEAPLGLTLRQIIDQFGDGMPAGSRFHFALTGGAAGTIVPERLLDMPIDFSSIAAGVALGSGAILVCDQSVSPLALVRELLWFFSVESCGKCTPCRVGTREALATIDRLRAGGGQPGDCDSLARLADLLVKTSLCGLGTTAALPIHSALRHFGGALDNQEQSDG